MFELKPTEVIVPIRFREAGRAVAVKHVFRPPSALEWIEFDKTLHARVEEEKDVTRLDDHVEEAAEALWEKCIARVDGYARGGRSISDEFPETACPATLKPEGKEVVHTCWRAKIPLQHKLGGVRGLSQVGIHEPEEEQAYEFNAESVLVILEAARNGEIFADLTHRLRRPTPEEAKAFSRLQRSTVFVRGSRTPTALLPSKLKEMVELYDKLVLEVGGYSVGGETITSRVLAIEAMDALHKRAAVEALFQPEAI